MGFRSGTQVTVDNALKMMLVKSANDMAVVLAEGVEVRSSISATNDQNAHRLGMTQTSFVNPNGLPADGQITSARDLAILARAMIHDLPEYEYSLATFRRSTTAARSRATTTSCSAAIPAPTA